MSAKRPQFVAVTMGDPAGVGPEICLQLLRDWTELDLAVPVVFGSTEILNRARAQCGWDVEFSSLSLQEWQSDADAITSPSVVDIPIDRADEITPGQVDASTGKAAFHYLDTAITEVIDGRAQALATAPLHKQALHAAGIPHPGHTEILAERTGTANYCMMLTSREVTVSLVTIHVPISEVPSLITPEAIYNVTKLTADAMTKIRGCEVRLAMCGLNPHAGEGGLWGDEEARLLQPALDRLRQSGIDIDGPLSADTAFTATNRKNYDAHICMYHDQGLIPIKALSFDTAVNVTLGLPIVRTSVDHGTALDIAWQGKADATSLFEAVRLAALMA
ncbi:4-hydroxythreonine-4-phosphate dehydrogenase PdxA [Calycomorphotria hydatis]|uniref:4-hydroxythreonine-4-phosphate dehydrogenase n=1 Tax=Calycomorphotria hydatis TaxID=2528027 RepID=A0A517T7D2_9PLAN|nr:4-hydroxythreonine-4-phosphate dehydrogenase PdxA [Calycomorphotria hydatis]QDT64260.1 4-hydroxythreonine-4-phosphate dehydrogenase [Calycomorphotria hydatis]